MRNFKSILVTAILVILVTTAVTACTEATKDSGGKSPAKLKGFTLVNETFPGDQYYVYPIRSWIPGELYFYSRGRYGEEGKGSFGKGIKCYRPDADGELVPAAMEWDPDDLDQVVGFLPEGFLWVGNCGSGERRDLFISDMKAHWGGGSGCMFFAKDRRTGRDRLLGQTEILPMYYSEKTGVVLVDYDGNGGARVKTNDGDPSGDGVQLQNAKAYGCGFVDDELVQVLVTKDGAVHRFDPVQVQLVPDSGLGWLKHVLKSPVVSKNNGDPIEFAFADQVLAVSGGDDHVMLMAQRGKAAKLEKRDVLSKDPKGKPRSEEELKKIGMDHNALRPEAYKIGAAFLSENVKVIPVDDTRIAVFDHDYQRLVFISVK